MFRKSSLVVIVVVSLLLATTNVVPAQSNESDIENNWVIGESSGQPIANGSYTKLVNQTNDRCLDYYERGYGINLGWRDCDSIDPNIRFVRESVTAGRSPLMYGERLAMRVTGHGYIRYGRRDFGINLVWSDTPVYEWEIRGGKIGDPVQTGASVALYNRLASDTVIYCVRTFGINLRWTNDCARAHESSNVANAAMTLRLGPLSSSTDYCTGRVIWQLTPIDLTGSAGISTVQTIDRDFNVWAMGLNERYCYVHYTHGNLKLGTWELSVSTPEWSTSCQIVLHTGNNLANFTLRRQGCVNGFGYPDD